MMNTNQNQNQQGDILFKKLDRMPEGEQKIIQKGKKVTVAHGESGHSHVLECDEDLELIQIGEKILLNLTKESKIVHEEHKAFVLSPGIHQFGQVREYDYFLEMERKVVD